MIPHTVRTLNQNSRASHTHVAMRSHLSMFNNSLGSGPTAHQQLAAGAPQPPPRRRANSMGTNRLPGVAAASNPRTGRNRQSSVVVGMSSPQSSLFDATDMVCKLSHTLDSLVAQMCYCYGYANSMHNIAVRAKHTARHSVIIITQK